VEPNIDVDAPYAAATAYSPGGRPYRRYCPRSSTRVKLPAAGALKGISGPWIGFGMA
jgi:hypothetical protein